MMENKTQKPVARAEASTQMTEWVRDCIGVTSKIADEVNRSVCQVASMANKEIHDGVDRGIEVFERAATSTAKVARSCNDHWHRVNEMGLESWLTMAGRAIRVVQQTTENASDMVVGRITSVTEKKQPSAATDTQAA